MIAQAIATARAAGVSGEILVRGDSAYGTSTVVAACRRAGARFSLVLTKSATVAAAIAAIGDDAWTPVNYPGAVRDPDTGAWISDAEVAETTYTAFGSTDHPVTARLIVRRVKDARYPDTGAVPSVALSPISHRLQRTRRCRRHHPPPPRHHRNRVRRPHRRPPGAHALRAVRRERFCAPRSPTTCCARQVFWPGPPTPWHGDQRCDGASSPSPPDWSDPNDDPSCTYLATGPGHSTGSHCGATPSDAVHPRSPPPDQSPKGPTGAHRESWTDQRLQAAHNPEHRKFSPETPSTGSIHGIEADMDSDSSSGHAEMALISCAGQGFSRLLPWLHLDAGRQPRSRLGP